MHDTYPLFYQVLIPKDTEKIEKQENQKTITATVSNRDIYLLFNIREINY